MPAISATTATTSERMAKMTERIPLMKCRTLTPIEETLACVDCGERFENFDDAIGDPWDDYEEDGPMDLEDQLDAALERMPRK